jgi:hypothetical protein
MNAHEQAFVNELDIFRREVDWAIQCFYGALTLHGHPFRHSDVLDAMNTSPLFWMTVRGAMMSTTWIVLGRIFDQDSPHNVDTVIRLAQKNPQMFKKEALGARRIADNHGIEPDYLKEYLKGLYEPDADDFRRLRKHIARKRKVYESKYRDIRHKIHAHKELIGVDAEALYANTRVREVEQLLAFVQGLQNALWQLFNNGRKPVLTPRPYSASRMIRKSDYSYHGSHTQQIIVNEAKQALDMLASGVLNSEGRGRVRKAKRK